MKTLFGRTGPVRLIRDFLSSSRGKTPELAERSESCQAEDLTGRRKILIVDDDAVTLKALKFKLESAGYAVATAQDGADALRDLRDERPDLVLLDINFPPDIGGGVTWDGFLLMRWLRGIEDVGKVPVLFMTGNDPGDYRDRAQACGASGFFHKPIEPSALIATIERVLSGKSGAFGLDANFQI